jgi:hypothetical protein
MAFNTFTYVYDLFIEPSFYLVNYNLKYDTYLSLIKIIMYTYVSFLHT